MEKFVLDVRIVSRKRLTAQEYEAQKKKLKIILKEFFEAELKDEVLLTKKSLKELIKNESFFRLSNKLHTGPEVDFQIPVHFKNEEETENNYEVESKLNLKIARVLKQAGFNTLFYEGKDPRSSYPWSPIYSLKM